MAHFLHFLPARTDDPLRVPGANNLQGRRATTVGRIRRSLGAFTIAAVMATGLILTPAELLAKGGNRGDNGAALIAFCQSVDASIDYINNSSLSDEIKAALTAPLQNVFETYCTGVAY